MDFEIVRFANIADYIKDYLLKFIFINVNYHFSNNLSSVIKD